MSTRRRQSREYIMWAKMFNGPNLLDSGNEHVRAANNNMATEAVEQSGLQLPSSNKPARIGDDQQQSPLKGMGKQLFKVNAMAEADAKETIPMLLTWRKRQTVALTRANGNSDGHCGGRNCETREIYQSTSGFDANQRAELAGVYQDVVNPLRSFQSLNFCHNSKSAERPVLVVKGRRIGFNEGQRRWATPVVGCSRADCRRPLTWPHCIAGLMTVIILSSNFSFVTATLAYTRRDNNRALPSQTGKIKLFSLLLPPY